MGVLRGRGRSSLESFTSRVIIDESRSGAGDLMRVSTVVVYVNKGASGDPFFCALLPHCGMHACPAKRGSKEVLFADDLTHGPRHAGAGLKPRSSTVVLTTLYSQRGPTAPLFHESGIRNCGIFIDRDWR